MYFCFFLTVLRNRSDYREKNRMRYAVFDDAGKKLGEEALNKNIQAMQQAAKEGKGL
jgi:hypothetical protein